MIICTACQKAEYPDSIEWASVKEFITNPTYESALNLKIPIPPGKLEDNLEARQQLANIYERYYVDEAEYHQQSNEFEKRGESIFLCLLKDLLEFILRYPRTVSALSAKYRIAREFVWGPKKYQEKGLAIHAEIAREHPDTWQGICALSANRGKPCSTPEEIVKFKRLDNEKDPEFLADIKLMRHPWARSEYIFTAEVLLGDAYYCANTAKNYDLAIEICKRIISEYPDTYAAKSAEWWIETFEYDRRQTRIYNWFKETYKREWTLTEARKLGKFREDFEKEHNRKSTAEEEIEFLKKLMFGADR